MTTDQKTFRRYLLTVFEDQRGDIIRAMMWMSNHFQRWPNTVRVAYHRLSISERNAVVREVLMNGD